MEKVGLRDAGKDFTKYLSYLEQEGLLVRINDEVDTEKDIGDYMYKSAAEGGPALLFQNIISRDLSVRYDIPLVGALICTRKRASIAIGAEEEEAMDRCIEAQQRPIAPVILDQDPVQRKVITGGDVDILRILPVSKCSPKDGGKYIGTGVLFTKDPEYGRNVTITRHQVLRKNRLGIVAFSPAHTAVFRKRAAERGEKLQVSIALGCAPDIVISSQFRPAIGVDECGIVGGLRGEPMRLVHGRTIKNEFPVSSHIVIEGEVPIDARETEGPFGEYTGYYGEQYDEQDVIDVKAIIIREDSQAVFYGSLPMPVENDVIKEIPIEATIFNSLKRACPGVTRVRCPAYGGCDDFVIVQLKKTHEDEGKLAILGTFSSSASRPKIVVIVDNDVDIFNDGEVLNALTYRMQPSKDVTIVRTAGIPLDPSYHIKSPEGASAMGIDATKPLRKTYVERVEDHRTQKEFPRN
jgi:UbiD family decarboxylase